MKYLNHNLKTALIIAGLVLLVFAVRESATIPVSSEEANLFKDSNDFSKSSLEVQSETEVNPDIDVQVSAAGAYKKR